MREGDAEHLRKVAELERILGPISRPNYEEKAAYDTARHCTAGAIVPLGEMFPPDVVYQAADISDRVTGDFLKGVEKIR